MKPTIRHLLSVFACRKLANTETTDVVNYYSTCIYTSIIKYT